MSDKSSPFKMSSFRKLFELDFSKEKSVFTPATDSCASNLTPIDCMETVHVEAKMCNSEVESEEWRRLSYVKYVLPLMYQPMAMKKTTFPEMESSGSIVDEVDYASRDMETLKLKLQFSSNEQRAHDAQLFLDCF
ncbi:hypothetical protein Tco_1210705 [Tanacetum coccineum]